MATTIENPRRHPVPTYADLLAHAQQIVVVGASPRAGEYGHEVAEAFCEAGYDVVAVSPECRRVEGLSCPPDAGLRSSRELPAHPDAAILVLPPASALHVLRHLAASGVHAVWLAPGTSTPQTAESARQLGFEVVAGPCPVQTLRGHV